MFYKTLKSFLGFNMGILKCCSLAHQLCGSAITCFILFFFFQKIPIWIIALPFNFVIWTHLVSRKCYTCPCWVFSSPVHHIFRFAKPFSLCYCPVSLLASESISGKCLLVSYFNFVIPHIPVTDTSLNLGLSFR